jgi:hypothetical protein
MKKLLPLLIMLFALTAHAQTATVISENVDLRGTPTLKGKVIETVSKDTSLEIIKQRGVWFLVQSPEFVGWVYRESIKLNSPLTVETVDDRFGLPEPQDTRPVYTQPKNVPTTVPESTPAVSAPSKRSSSYIRGPRGGCYYINSSGKKTYVDRSLCN